MRVRSAAILRREKVEITLDQLVDLFLATKLTEGRSQKTTDWYAQKLSKFIEFLGEESTLPDFTLNNARAFVAHLQGKKRKFDDHPFRPVENEGLSAFTIQGYVRTLKSFSSWLAEDEFTTQNVLSRLKMPKAPTPVIEVLSDEEISNLLSAINPKCLLGARMHTIFLLLLDTGIRASELCGLTLEDTHIKEGYIKVFGKGQKERMVPFGNTVKKNLLRWVVTWRPALAEEDNRYLLVTNDGLPLTYSALNQAIKRLGRRAGIPRLHAHLFRHTFAVKYLMNGGDVMTLKLMLGHTTLTVTQMYMHLASAHIQIQHHKFSPVDRLNMSKSRKRR